MESRKWKGRTVEKIEEQISDIRCQISGKTRAKKQQKKRAKKLSNVFAFLNAFVFADN